MDDSSPKMRLRQAVQKVGFNREADILFGTVTAAYPNTRVKLDIYPFEFDDFAICEHLTKHTRTASISGGATQTIDFDAALNVGDRVVVASFNKDQQHLILDRLA